MKKTILTAIGVLIAVTASNAAEASHRGFRFSAHLSGLEEVPSIISEGSGSATFRLFGDRIEYELTIDSLEGEVLFTHIHIGQKGANGGVSTFLCDNTGNPNAGGAPPCPQSGVVSGTVRAEDVIGPAAQGVEANDFQGLVEAIFSGVAYVNTHSDLFPAGELRGQIDRRGFSRFFGRD
ncbi:MAG: CHRD domain-containing protein [Myxococcota bacterium]